MSKQPVKQLYKCDICKLENLEETQLGIGWVFTPADGIPADRGATIVPGEMAGYSRHLCQTCLHVYKELL